MSGIEGLALVAVEWAVTYAVHSSLLLGLSAILTYRLLRSDAWREILWRGALLGPLLTATVVTLAPLEPLAGRIGLGAPGGAALTSTGSPGAGGGADPATARPQGGDAPPTANGVASPQLSPATGRERRDPRFEVAGAASLPLIAWAVTASLLLGLLLRRNREVFRRLRTRRQVEDGPLPRVIAELRRRAGMWQPVKLSVSAACPAPLVLGRGEICVPPQFLSDLTEEQQRAALAHELAHIRRRDPLWQIGTGILGALLFFQPLNILARLRLREAAEHLCDDWAVRQTGAPLALGQCLATVASWISTQPEPPLQGTHAMAEGGSPLVHRIRRIYEGIPRTPDIRLPAVLSVLMLLGATALAAPAAGPAVLAQEEAPGLSDGGPASDLSGADPVPSVGSPPTGAADTLGTIRTLEALAMSDPSPLVRQEAATALSDFDHPAAAAALIRILREATDTEIRAEAAQHLEEFPTDEVVRALLEAIFEDGVEDVWSNALDTLEDLSLESAQDALRTVAREHPLVEVRLAAVAALSGEQDN